MASPSISLTDEQIALLLEQATAPTPQDGQPAAAPPLKYRLGNQTFEAASPEELQQQLDAAMNSINATVKQLQAGPAAPAATPAAPTFEKEQYAKLFLEDPMAAAEYLDSIRFGVAQPAQVIKTIVKDVSAMEQSLAVQQFMGSTEGYTATPENFATLTGYMQSYGLPWTANGMKLAFGQARLDGKIRDESDQQQQEPQGRFGMQTRRGVPTVPRGGTSSANVDQELLARYEDLSPEKMKIFLEGLQAN